MKRTVREFTQDEKDLIKEARRWARSSSPGEGQDSIKKAIERANASVKRMEDAQEPFYSRF